MITYACELWGPNKEEKGTINRILDNIIKRVLMVPTSTSREDVFTNEPQFNWMLSSTPMW